MSDLNPSLTTVCSIILWIAGFAVGGYYALYGVRGMGVFAILFAAGGATLTIRRFLICLADDLLRRERNAFMLGQDAQRIRSVE